MTVERLSLYIALSIIGGGLAAAIAINPEIEAGPVRVGTYLAFALGSGLMFRKHIRIVRHNDDNKANVYIVAATYFWLGFTLACLLIAYLISARAFGFAPHLSEGTQLRISYFFISGAAIGLVYMAVVFTILPVSTLLGHRVPAWPLTFFKRRPSAIEPYKYDADDDGDGQFPEQNGAEHTDAAKRKE